MFVTDPQLVYLMSAVACASAGAITDYRSRRIPNWITASGFLAGIGLHGLMGGWRGMLAAMVAGLLAGGLFLLFFLAGGMGGGDVKLIAAVCCLAGLSQTVEIVIATALLGGIFAVVLAFRSRRLVQTLTGTGELLAHHWKSGLKPHPEINLGKNGSLRLPYGIVIAAGTVYSLCSAIASGAR